MCAQTICAVNLLPSICCCNKTVIIQCWSVKVLGGIRTMAEAPVTIVLPCCMQQPPCPSPALLLLLLLLLSLLTLSLGQCRVAEEPGGAEYTLVQQSSSTIEQNRLCLPGAQIFRRQGVDYCFTKQEQQGSVYTRAGVESGVLQHQ